MIRRVGEDRRAAQREREDQKQRGWHLAGERQDGQGATKARHRQLHENQQPAPVEYVSQRAADEPEQHIRQKVGGLHQRDQDCRVRQVH